LPKGWVITTVESLFFVVGGGTPSTNKAEYWGNGIPWFSSADIDEYGIITPRRCVTQFGLESSTTNVVPKGSVVVVTRVGLGKVAITDDDMCFSQDNQALIPQYSEVIDHRYLFHFLLHEMQTLKHSGRGTTISGITKKQLSDIYLWIPPLAEQRRIVSAIESAFAVIDEIEQNKTDLQSAIAVAKQKILSLAIRGKLVKQDPNDEPASVLLESIRSEREKLIDEGKIKRGKGDSAIIRSCDSPYYKNLPKSWKVVSLSQITNPLILNDGDWILSENMVKNGDVKLVQLGSVGFMEYIDKGFKYLTSEMFSELNCTTIYPNYLLINRLLGDRLNLCILPDTSGTLITTVDTCWIAPNKYYNLKFLMYSIASEPFQKSVFINSAGSTRKRISKGNLIQIPFSFPPLAEQNRIVVAIEAAFEQLDRIAENLN
jgi:type I restriction enzyme S subunit